MRTEILNSELEAICLAAVEASVPMDDYFHLFTKVLYLSGLRIGEVLDLSRWTQKPHGAFEVKLQKGESKRTIEDYTEEPNTYTQYFNAERPLWFSYSAANFRLKQILPRLEWNSDSRRTVAHAFRYNYIRKNYELNPSIEDIQTLIAHESLGSTALYIMQPTYLVT